MIHRRSFLTTLISSPLVMAPTPFIKPETKTPPPKQAPTHSVNTNIAEGNPYHWKVSYILEAPTGEKWGNAVTVSNLKGELPQHLFKTVWKVLGHNAEEVLAKIPPKGD